MIKKRDPICFDFPTLINIFCAAQKHYLSFKSQWDFFDRKEYFAARQLEAFLLDSDAKFYLIFDCYGDYDKRSTGSA